MIIYNITINVEDSIHYDWLFWIKPHIKQVLATGKFISAKMTKIMVEEEMEGTNYSIQYTAKTREDLNAYYDEYAPKLRKKGIAKFGSKMLAFRTELLIIEEFHA
ncbi:DUF4286 family protein [Flavobacteriaceae bacterium]|nr:DUF4286 family protein [Flavobacteriaceae bacterium]